MIEVTEEMVRAFRSAFNQKAAEMAASAPDFIEGGVITRAGLSAVLALVEQDYEPRRCDQAMGLYRRCTQPSGHDRRHMEDCPCPDCTLHRPARTDEDEARETGRRMVADILAFEELQKTHAKDLSDPTEVWREALDGKLTQTQRDLAASQEDLTLMQEDRDAWHRVAERVTAQRDEARAEAAEIRAQLLAAAEQRQFLHERLAEARRDLIRSENDLGRVRFERDHARTWQVARNDDAGDCVLCGQPIVRSQAFEPQVGAAAGSYSHVECPEAAS